MAAVTADRGCTRPDPSRLLLFGAVILAVFVAGASACEVSTLTTACFGITTITQHSAFDHLVLLASLPVAFAAALISPVVSRRAYPPPLATLAELVGSTATPLRI